MTTETLKVDEERAKVVAYLANGDAVGPSDFAGGEEEMHFAAKQEGWEPLVRAQIIMTTSREQFEQEIKKKFGDLIDYRVCKNSDGQYMAWDMQVAWWAWQASRTTIAVELPEPYYDEHGNLWFPQDATADSIHAAGITVKGDSDAVD